MEEAYTLLRRHARAHAHNYRVATVSHAIVAHTDDIAAPTAATTRP